MSKASGPTQSKEVVDRREIHEFNSQATTPINILPTLYQILWCKISRTTRTTGRIQAGWVQKETSIPDNLKKTCSTFTHHQATTPPTMPNRARMKTVAKILIQAMALALKPPLRVLAREEAPGAEQPIRPVPQDYLFLF